MAYDSLTNTFLMTVPEKKFYNMEERIVRSADSHGTMRDGRLCYTFLPIVQLRGSFDNEYQRGEIIIDDTDDSDAFLLHANIKWRGGTTNVEGKHKRNYKIKLDDDTSLFGMRDDDSWILDAGQKDVFRLRNLVAMNLWNDMGSTPYYADKEPEARLGISGTIVEVFLNDEYQGIYNFSENLDRKQLKIKKVSSNSGVRGCVYRTKGYGIAQMYKAAYDYDNHSEMWDKIEVKYPDLSDCDSTDWSTLANAINFVAESSDFDFSQQVGEYFDIPVVIDFCIFGSVMNAYDNRAKNLVWAVYNKKEDKKLTLAPWDLDCTAGQRWVNYFDEKTTSPDTIAFMKFNLTKRLEILNACNFNETFSERYTELRQGVLSTKHVTKLYTDAFMKIKNSGAVSREEQRWSGDSDIKGATLDMEEEYDYICGWINDHLAFMDAKYLDYDVIKKLISKTRIYNLSGQRQSRLSARGIYIIQQADGKTRKVIMSSQVFPAVPDI